MTHPNARKGAAAERELADLLANELGFTVKRRRNLGTHEDVGDLYGVPDLTVQCANWGDIARAVRVKPLECEQQRLNAGTQFAATFLRLRGGEWRVVLSVPQYLTLYREATA
jgi:Holliday junction resolvase